MNLEKFFTSSALKVWLAGLIVLNLALKIYSIEFNSLGGDEPYSTYVMQMPLSDIITYQLLDNNPPLYEGLLHFWIQVFGIEEWSVRLPSVLFNCGTLIFLFLIGRKYDRPGVAVAAGLMFIFSNFQLEYAQQARAYSLLGLTTTGAMFFFLEFLHSAKSLENLKPWRLHPSIRGSFWGLLVMDILVMNTHYMGLLILLTQVVVVLTEPKILKRIWSHLILFSALFLLAWSPILISVVKRAQALSGGVSWISPPDLEGMYNVVRMSANVPVIAALSISLFGILFLYLLATRFKGFTLYHKTVVAWFAFPVIFLWLYSFRSPAFIPRYLIPSTVGLMLLLAMSVGSLFRVLWLRVALLFTVVLLFAATYHLEHYNQRNDRLLVETVRAKSQPNSLVVLCPKFYDVNFSYYFDRSAFQTVRGMSFFDTIDEELRKKNVYSVWHVNEFPKEGYDHLIYVDVVAHLTNPANAVLDSLDVRMNRVSEETIDGFFKIYEFSN